MYIDNLNYEFSQCVAELNQEGKTTIHLFCMFMVFKTMGDAQQRRLEEPLI